MVQRILEHAKAKKGIESNRIGNISDSAIDIDSKINKYNQLVEELLAWIQSKIELFNQSDFENNLDGVQRQLSEFNSYRKALIRINLSRDRFVSPESERCHMNTPARCVTRSRSCSRDNVTE